MKKFKFAYAIISLICQRSVSHLGENVLHIAIVNEDPAMVKFLLDSGADVHERCFGSFMCPEDQKASRFDSMEHEWVCVTPETDYSGYFRIPYHLLV